jgi:hypothetical protein
MPTGVGVGDRVGVEHVEGHGDDLALELGAARADVALQGVDVAEQTERLVHEVVVVVVAAVVGARDLAGLPDGVLLGGHLAQLVEQLLGGTALFGHGPVDRETVGVGVGAAHDSRA